MPRANNILTILCSCGEIVSKLKVSGDIEPGTKTEESSCWRCRNRKKYNMSDRMDKEVRLHRRRQYLEE